MKLRKEVHMIDKHLLIDKDGTHHAACVCGSQSGFYPCTQEGRVLRRGEEPPGNYFRCVRCGRVYELNLRGEEGE
jgi:hypothetical protein